MHGSHWRWSVCALAVGLLSIGLPRALGQENVSVSADPGYVIPAPHQFTSGSTLLACERTGRICLGLELDPLYVAVAVERWEAFSGETAVRISAREDE